MNKEQLIQAFVIVILILFIFESFFSLTKASSGTPTTENTTAITFTGSATTNATITYLLDEIRFNTNKTDLKKSISEIPGVDWVLESKGRYVITVSPTANRSILNTMLMNLDDKGSAYMQAYIAPPKNITFTSFAGENRSDIEMPDTLLATIYDPSLSMGNTTLFKIYVDVRNGQHVQTPSAVQLVEKPQLNIRFLNGEGNVISASGYSLSYSIDWENRTLNTTEIKEKIPFESEISYTPINNISFISNLTNLAYVSNLSYLQNATLQGSRTTAIVVENMTNKTLILSDIPNAEFPASELYLFLNTTGSFNLSDAMTWVPGKLTSVNKVVSVNVTMLYDNQTNKTFTYDQPLIVDALPDVQLNDSINFTAQALFYGEKIINARGEQIKTAPS